MYKKLLFLPLLLLTLNSTPLVSQTANAQTQITQIEEKELDQRAKVLANYFAKFNSPLEYHAQDFIDASDHYGVDWKLVPAIAGVESTFGKNIPGGFNAWGWAIYTPSSRYGFKSWRDGIYTVTGGLKQNYINKGLTTPFTMNRVYAASPAWGGKVNFFMNDLEKFSQNYQKSDTERVKNPLSKTVGSSAWLVYNYQYEVNTGSFIR